MVRTSSKKNKCPSATSSKSTVPAKAARTEVPLHPSQVALAALFMELTEKLPTGIIIGAPPGYGKTRAARGVLDMMDKKGGDLVGCDLHIFVSKTPALARSQGHEVGSHYKAPMTMANISGLAKALETKAANESIRVCMTHAMFTKLFTKYYFVDDFVTPLGSPRIHIVLDEVHCFYIKSPAVATAVAMMFKYTSMRITGLTATPQLDGHELRAARLFGGEPQIVEYTDEEAAQFKADLMSHRPADAKWQKVAVKNPANNDDSLTTFLDALRTIMVGIIMKNGGEEPVHVNAWKARNNLISMIVATQVHGDDGTGGEMFKKLATAQKKLTWNKCVEEDNQSLTESNQRAPVVLLVHRYPAGGELHHGNLCELAADADAEGVQKFIVHDLRASDLNAFREHFDRFTEDVNQKEEMILAVVDKRQIEGTNDYAKNVSTIVAVGEWTDAELTQLGGRLGRPCVLEQGDLLPDAFTLIHFESKTWASHVCKLGLVDQGPFKVSVPDDYSAEFEALDDKEKKKANHLIAGGKFLHCDLLSTYFESMDEGSTFETEYKKAVRKWCAATGHTDDE